MPNLTLYIDTVNNLLVTNLNRGAVVEANSLPFFFGDTIPMRVYLLTPLQEYQPGAWNYSIIPTTGLALFLYIDDGTVSGTTYTQQIVWTADTSEAFFYANLALNTAALQTLLGSNKTAVAYIKIGYVQDGLQTTVLSQPIEIGVGLPLVSLVVPAGQTPLSAEVANATYFPKQPVNGQPCYIASPNGKVFALTVIDNPDGTASFEPVQTS